jgi:hypothetical protein
MDWDDMTFEQKVIDLEFDLAVTDNYNLATKELPIGDKKVKVEFLNRSKEERDWSPGRNFGRFNFELWGDFRGGLLRKRGTMRIYKNPLELSRYWALRNIHHEIKHAKDHSRLGYFKDYLKMGAAQLATGFGAMYGETSLMDYIWRNSPGVFSNFYGSGLDILLPVAMIAIPLAVGIFAGKKVANKLIKKGELSAESYAKERVNELYGAQGMQEPNLEGG